MKIGIIGMGAAGMMAAASILEQNKNIEILLFEKNTKIGSKVIISGGGRCNVTTGINSMSEVLKKYPRGSKFIKKAMLNFPPQKVVSWFEGQGVKLKTENDLRVFPESDNGNDIVKVFESLFIQNSKCSLFLKTEIKDVHKQKDGFEIISKESQKYFVDKLIITTGGQAFRHTGSTGDGYKFAEDLGHTITKLGPGLNSFILQEDWVKNLAGVSHKHVKFKSNSEGKKVVFEGPCIWTHKGKSGPAIFAMSSLLAFENISKNNPLDIYLDLYPQLDQESLKNDLLKLKNQNKLFKNSFIGIIPKRLTENMFEVLGIDTQIKSAEIKNKDIFRIVEFIKNLKLKIIGRGKGDEFVTAGGIDTNDVNPNTMESKVCKNLFFAGEILDVDGFTGGFNLQASWATGKLAGISCVVD